MLLMFLAALCAVLATLCLHGLTNYLRLHASQVLVVAGLVSVTLVGLFGCVQAAVLRQYGAEVLVCLAQLAVFAAPVVVIALVARLHCWRRGVPLGIAFSHLMAEMFCAVLLLLFVIPKQDALVNVLTGGNANRQQLKKARKHAGAAANTLAVTLSVVLLTLELLHPFHPLGLRRRVASE